MKSKNSKWNRRFGKWIASLLTTILLVNQISFSVLAEEPGEVVCCCDTCCTADSVNEVCMVCAEDYGNCEGAEVTADTIAKEEAEDSGTGEGTDNDTPDDSGIGEAADTEKETGDVGADGAVDKEEVEGSDSVEGDTDAEDEGGALLQENEEENVIEEDTINLASAGDTFDDGVLTYTVIKEEGNDQQVEVTGHVDGTSVSGALVIPSKVSNGSNEYKVVSIGSRAFFSCENLTSVIIPESVTSIGEFAFYYCDNIESVTISDNVNCIEKQAFYGCSSLKSITIPKGVTSIEESVFQFCSGLENIVIPQGVTSIGAGAFSVCSNIKYISIPDSVISIGQAAFSVCSNLKSIEVPERVTSIENSTFYNCSSLENVTISSNVTEIGQYAFSRCSSLNSITIPGNVTSIDCFGFAECSNLESVTVLNDTIGISREAFDDCGHFSRLQIAVPENITATPSVDNMSFSGCPADRYLTFLTKDGKTELSDTTKPTLAEAKGVYDAVNDGGINDDYWYGWKLSKDPVVTDHPVTIRVTKDGSDWGDCPKKFALSPDNGSTFITDLMKVSNGTYIIYETEAADGTGYVSTGISVEVKDVAASVEIHYYTATFYNEDTVFDEQIVLENARVSAPAVSPTKDGYTFYRWVTSRDGSTEFDFGNPITAKTDIYASWSQNEILYTITASAGTGGSISPGGEVKVKSGADQQFTITPQEGYRIASILADGNEALTDGGQTAGHAKAGITDAGNNAKYYVFENVTSDHTLEAHFKTVHPVTIEVNKDGSSWVGCPKRFALSSDHGSTFITDFTDVLSGTYIVYETEVSDGTGYASTGISVEVVDAAVNVEINYYTVTFYNEDTVFEEQIVLENAKVNIPSASPTKEGYTFYRWVTSKDGSTEFDFAKPITAKTDIYAGWSKEAEKLFTITASAGAGGSVSPSGDIKVKSGADQQFTITPQKGYQISSILVDGSEAFTSGVQTAGHVKTGIADAGNNAKYYVFENVTGDHTLAAYFKASDPGDNDPNDPNDPGNDDSSDDSGSGGGGRDTNDNGGSDSSGSDASAIDSAKSFIFAAGAISDGNHVQATNESEPKTGDSSYMEIYATIAMIAGLSYILLYFVDGKSGMTEEEKKEIVAALVKWAKEGRCVRKYMALAAIFLILVYYHSIGKRTMSDWKEVYEK